MPPLYPAVMRQLDPFQKYPLSQVLLGELQSAADPRLLRPFFADGYAVISDPQTLVKT